VNCAANAIERVLQRIHELTADGLAALTRVVRDGRIDIGSGPRPQLHVPAGHADQ
jgi:hypothetical protein